MISISRCGDSSGGPRRRRIMEDFERILRSDPEFDPEGLDRNYTLRIADQPNGLCKREMIDGKNSVGTSMKFGPNGMSLS